MMKLAFKAFGMIVVIASGAHAGALKDAIRAGKACEKQDGFVQATLGSKNESGDLVTKVNVKRQILYAQIAADRGVSPAVVAQESAAERHAKNPERFCKDEPAPCR